MHINLETSNDVGGQHGHHKDHGTNIQIEGLFLLCYPLVIESLAVRAAELLVHLGGPSTDGTVLVLRDLGCCCCGHGRCLRSPDMVRVFKEQQGVLEKGGTQEGGIICSSPPISSSASSAPLP